MTLLLFLLALGSHGGPLTDQPLTAPLELRTATPTVGRFEKIEFEIHGLESGASPFDPTVIDVRLELTDTNGQRSSVPAFHIQPYERRRFQNRDWIYPTGLPLWKSRFAPMAPGRFEAVAVGRDVHGERRSPPCAFECVPSSSKGFLRVSRRDPRFLEFNEGHPFFAIGQNLAFIGSGQYMTLARAEETFGRLAANGANYLRIWTGCEDWALALEAPKSAWDRSWSRRAPIVPMPDDPARKCLRLDESHAVQEVNPSHPVALRPNTRYTVTGESRIEPGSALRLEVSDTTAAASGSADLSGWYVFRHEFTTGPNQRWLGFMRFRLEGPGPAWLADLSLKEANDGPELLWEAELNGPTRGFYNPLDCFMLDELVSSAQQHGIYLQLCLLTRDLYLDALKDPASPEYDQAIADAQDLLRYAVARWGYATSVAAWSPMCPGPADNCDR